MASDVVIRAEGLGKKYIIGHEAQREPYVALRDVLARGVRDAWRKTADMFRGRAILSGDTTEEFWALKDVSFQVERGEVLGIIGRNGAGKSTLLKILSRITEPSEGRVTIEGRMASLLEVGTGFHAELTGRENVYLNGTILGMKRAEIRRHFDEIVSFAGVEKFLDTPVKRYSSGMYVRLAFAVAAHLEPEILIIDEVLAVGDAEFQKRCLGKMRDFSCAGRTVLFVSHNLGAVTALCHRAILLEAGQLKCDLPPPQAVAAYLGPSRNVVTFREFHNGASIIRAEVDEEGLLNGDLILRIDFTSPEVISPVVPGLVLYDEEGRAIYGSNPRIHPEGFTPRSLSGGRIRFEARDLPIVSGTYLLSLWLGDWHKDYDYKAHILSLTFEPRNPRGGFKDDGPLNWSGHWHTEDQTEGPLTRARSPLALK